MHYEQIGNRVLQVEKLGFLKKVGVDELHRPVLGNIYGLYQTYGLPLEDIQSWCEAKGCVIALDYLTAEMLIAGVKEESIPDRIAGIYEAKGPAFKEEIRVRVRGLMMWWWSLPEEDQVIKEIR